MAVSISLSNALSKKGTPPKNYLSEPLDVVPDSEYERRLKEQKQLEKDRMFWQSYFNRMEKLLKKEGNNAR